MPWGSLHRLGALALIALSVAFFGLRCATSQEIAFVEAGGELPWVMPPVPVSAELRQWGRADVPVTSYQRGLQVEDPARPATLELRAYRGFRVLLNGAPVKDGEDDGARWREIREIELAPLHAGWNELRIDIANAHGPALLALKIEGLPETVVSGPSFEVTHDGERLGAAIPADDTRRNPAARRVATPAASFWKVRNPTLAIFVAGGALFLFLRKRHAGRAPAALPYAALVAGAAGWWWIFVDRFLRLPIEVGFDARHHSIYVDFLREHGAVPLATDGWSAYHPPLFYAFAALLEAAGETLAGDAGGVAGLKALPFLAGLGNVWVAFALCRRLLPGDPSAQFAATLFAAVLPMNLYSAAYFSNETFHTLLAGVAILLALDLIAAGSTTPRRVVALGLVLALALLTKYTAVLVTAVVGFFLVAKWLALERLRPARIAILLLALALPPLALAGWFYLRNALVFGDPLIANWGHLPGETQRWWQQPGFHTAGWYLGFGETFRYPYLSAFHSYWDSLYSTLWGDGGIAGRVDPGQRHALWNYDFMTSGYLVALPAFGFTLAGAVRSVIRAFSEPDPSRRAAFSLLATLAYAVLFGLTYMSLRLPYFAQAKASYGLVVMPVLAFYFADGYRWLDAELARRDWQPVRAVSYGWLAAFAGTCFLAFAG